MKIAIEKTLLVQTLAKVLNVINPKSNLPILSNILIETLDSKIKITATDLDLGITTTVTTTVQEPGAITVPAKRFAEIVRELPEGEVRFTAKKNNTVSIEGPGCVFRLMGLPKEEFPQLPDFKQREGLRLNQADLLNMLELTSFAMSHDETRFTLNGILFEFDGQALRMVATDGRRLALMAKNIIAGGTAKKMSIIVPAKTIQELMRSMQQTEEEVALVIAENQILFEIGTTSIVSRLIEGEFPNYKQVIPPNCANKAHLDRLGFLAALRRASLLATPDFQAVKLELFPNKMVVNKSTPDVGESREEVTMRYEGKDMAIGFNPYYLTEVLKILKVPEVTLELNDPEKPALIREGDYVYIVLPMRIQ
jgi:DNA polymerase-3 subunit beta